MTPAERSRAYRIRQGERAAAQYLESPDLLDAVREAIRSPELLVHVSLHDAMREVGAMVRAWFARGLRLPPSTDQLAYGLDALLVRGAGGAAASAMPAIPKRGTTYKLWREIVNAGQTVTAATGAWAAEWIARLSGKRARVKRGRTGSPASPSLVTDSLAFSAGSPKPPPDPPPGDPGAGPEALRAVMLRIGWEPKR